MPKFIFRAVGDPYPDTIHLLSEILSLSLSLSVSLSGAVLLTKSLSNHANIEILSNDIITDA